MWRGKTRTLGTMQRAKGSRRMLKLVAGGLLVVGLVPFPTTTVPEWRLQYVDGAGRPVAGLPVEQTWQNYSIESTGNLMTLRTDTQGYVVFPSHSTWSPFLLRVLGPVGNVFRTGVHASFGPSSWLIPKCDVRAANAHAIHTGSNKLPGQIVLKYEDSSSIRAVIPARDLLPVPPECAAIEAQVRGK
jgi:hypothetical protein